ncbi:MAG: hypothetical protein IJR51_02800, partial [Clostridia bacterium]|nr:hypothetical protein [Clostridia bacterium]
RSANEDAPAELIVCRGDFASSGTACCAVFINERSEVSSLGRSPSSLKLSFSHFLFGGYSMRNDALSVQSMDFAVSVVNLVKDLRSKHEHLQVKLRTGQKGSYRYEEELRSVRRTV